MGEEDRYRLAPVRNARTRDERVKRGDLSAAVWDANETAARLELAQLRTIAARAALTAAKTARDAQGTAALIAAAHDQQIGIVDVARQRLVRARADRQVIERHFERWREDRKKLADRRED